MTLKITGLHHDHIDGSIAVIDIIEDLYRAAGRPFPFSDRADMLRFFQNPYEDIVARFAAVTGVAQTREALSMLGEAYGRRRAAEGYRYVEARFAPQYHTAGGLTLEQAADAMIQGLSSAERATGIIIHPMICIGREADPETGLAIARVCLERDGEVSMDLACDEAGHPPEKHLPAFALTRGTKVRRDCHAGEWVAKEPAATYRRRLLENVRTAVRVLEADGIGHAIPLADDPDLVREVVDRGIRVAACPLSNLSGGLIGDVRDLRLAELLDAGVALTLNADDDLFLPPMPEVLAACQRAYAFSEDEWRLLDGNVRRGAFSARVRVIA